MKVDGYCLSVPTDWIIEEKERNYSGLIISDNHSAISNRIYTDESPKDNAVLRSLQETRCVSVVISLILFNLHFIIPGKRVMSYSLRRTNMLNIIICDAVSQRQQSLIR